MDRLTTDDEYLSSKAEYERHLEQGYPRNIPKERFLRLCEYEQTNMTPGQIAELRKQLLVCIGDTVYLVDFTKRTIDSSIVLGIVSQRDGSGTMYTYHSERLEFCDEDIGVCVFLTSEAAKQALELERK